MISMEYITVTTFGNGPVVTKREPVNCQVPLWGLKPSGQVVKFWPWSR